MLVAQLSDLHIRREGEFACHVVDTAACLGRAVARLNALDPLPDVVLLTGDLVDSGEAPDEYGHLRRLLAPLRMPYLMIPGNHDGRDALRAVFHDHPHLHEDREFIHYVVDADPLRLILLDTLDPGQESGLLDEPRLDWLAARLAQERERPTLVAMHHPPFMTGIQFMDKISCRGGDRMADIIRRNPQVERVLCGHVHRFIQTRWAGTAACVAPSTAHQLVLDLRDRDTSPGEFNLEPAGFLLHLWQPAGGVITHTCLSSSFEGPYRFEQ
jgi:3',5'-cyclic-AMP phosphodiesterase